MDSSSERLYAYPRRSPRILASARLAVYPYTVPRTTVARIEATLSGTPGLRRVVWRRSDAPSQRAFALGLSALGLANSRQVVAHVSGVGEGARALVLVAPSCDHVAKLAIDGPAAARVAAEAVAYDRAREVLRESLFPKAIRRGQVLLVERVVGAASLWDDPRAHSWVIGDFVDESGYGVLHGDLVPWNVIFDGERFVAIDWEKAQLDQTVDPACNLLDFVIRGSLVARSHVHSVATALRNCLRTGLVTAEQLDNALATYEAYRNSVEVNSTRRDVLHGSSVRRARALRALLGLDRLT